LFGHDVSGLTGWHVPACLSLGLGLELLFALSFGWPSVVCSFVSGGLVSGGLVFVSQTAKKKKTPLCSADPSLSQIAGFWNIIVSGGEVAGKIQLEHVVGLARAIPVWGF
jgi:hypothetical protein